MEYLRRNWIDFETPQNVITIKKETMNSNIEFVNDTLNGGFLSGFVEASVEKPADGLNGACVVHYAGQYSDSVMKVKMVNGKREGIAEIAMDGVPYSKLEYRNGRMTGIV